MPRQNKRPTTILADEESDDDVEFQQDPPPAKLVSGEPPTCCSQHPGNHHGVQAPNGYGKSSSQSGSESVPGSPPTVESREDKVKTNIAELVAILSTSNASMRGKIDDTGRFELSFELIREPTSVYTPFDFVERPASPVRSIPTTGSPSSVRGGKPGKRVGWVRT